jgi:N-acyl-D-amino-acid deacylase
MRVGNMRVVLGLVALGLVSFGTRLRAADLVLFDPARVIDQSTIEQPEAPPLGIPGVMVSGECVIDDGRVTGRHPGRVLKSAAAQRFAFIDREAFVRAQ